MESERAAARFSKTFKQDDCYPENNYNNSLDEIIHSTNSLSIVSLSRSVLDVSMLTCRVPWSEKVQDLFDVMDLQVWHH